MDYSFDSLVLGLPGPLGKLELKAKLEIGKQSLFGAQNCVQEPPVVPQKETPTTVARIALKREGVSVISWQGVGVITGSAGHRVISREGVGVIPRQARVVKHFHGEGSV